MGKQQRRQKRKKTTALERETTHSSHDSDDNTEDNDRRSAARSLATLQLAKIPTSSQQEHQPSTRYFQKNRSPENLLMCICLGLRDEDGSVMKGSDFRGYPYKHIKNGCWRFKPTLKMLVEEAQRRARLLGISPIGANSHIDIVCGWLTHNPIQDPEDVEFFRARLITFRDKIAKRAARYPEVKDPYIGKYREVHGLSAEDDDDVIPVIAGLRERKRNRIEISENSTIELESENSQIETEESASNVESDDDVDNDEVDDDDNDGHDENGMAKRRAETATHTVDDSQESVQGTKPRGHSPDNTAFGGTHQSAEVAVAAHSHHPYSIVVEQKVPPVQATAPTAHSATTIAISKQKLFEQQIMYDAAKQLLMEDHQRLVKATKELMPLHGKNVVFEITKLRMLIDGVCARKERTDALDRDLQSMKARQYLE